MDYVFWDEKRITRVIKFVSTTNSEQQNNREKPKPIQIVNAPAHFNNFLQL